MDRGAGGLQSMGSQRVGHDWSDLACIHVLWIVIFLVPHWSFAPLSIFEYFYQIFRPLSIASISIFIIFLIDLVLSVIDWSWKRKSRNTWSNSQIWPWSTEWSRAKANRFCQENALVIANTLFQQYERRLYTWTSPDGQYRNQVDYSLCSQTWRSSLQQNQDQQLTVALIMNSLLPNSDILEECRENH